MATITDILISELDRAVVPATGDDELVINQLEPNSGDFVTRRITWTEVGQSIKDLSGDPDNNNGLTNQVMFGDGTEPAPSITFKSDTSTGIYKPQLIQPAVAFTSGGLEVLRAVDVSTTARYVGIGFANNDSNIPEDSLHVKGGGIKIQFSSVNAATNVLHFKLATDGPSIDTTKPVPLIFATNNRECGRFTEDSNVLLYGSLGVGIGPSTVSHGDMGHLLLSRGINNSMEWSSPEEFFLNNLQIIEDILSQTDGNYAEGIDVRNYPDGYPAGEGKPPGEYVYATYIFNHLDSLS